VLLAVAQVALAAGPAAAPAPPLHPRRAPAGAPAATAPSPRTPAGPLPVPTHVEADGIEYLYKEHRTVMTGKPLVKFTREDAVLVCRKMVADHDQAGDIQHAVCEGDVKLTRGEKVVTCNRATYDAAANNIVCRGDPVLRDGASIMHSDEVIYDIERDKVFLKRGRGTIVQKPGQKVPGKKGQAQ
jgi:lipopolysaccharide export system protein LptA